MSLRCVLGEGGGKAALSFLDSTKGIEEVKGLFYKLQTGELS